MRLSLSLLLLALMMQGLMAQTSPEILESPSTLARERRKLKESLYARTIGETFRYEPTADFEYRYESAFWAVSQFMVDDSLVREGFRKTMQAYGTLGTGTRRSFLEAFYAVDPPGFDKGIESILRTETVPKLFAMAALQTIRRQPGKREEVLRLMKARWPGYSKDPILQSLEDHLNRGAGYASARQPDLHDWFEHQRRMGVATVYSFQRWNRDFMGLAVVQFADGRFARDSSGRLVTIRQLARSASNLPYFITNGNTPQGLFRITGIGRSTNTFIGPTPNLQMTMPFEGYWKDFSPNDADTTDPAAAYGRLLPETWRSLAPMYESFRAGKAGRTEIIAHGTTIDPEYFRGKPFHPVSPTLGCLCALERWDPQTGRLSESDQWLLARTFTRNGDSTGYMVVVNVSDRREAIGRAEVEAIVDGYERKMGQPPVKSPQPVR